MEWRHPVLQEMLQMGCSDQMQVMVAFQTYMKLCEVDKLWDVQIAYDKELNIVYLTSSDKSPPLLYVPLSTQKNLSPALLHRTRVTLLGKHPDADITILVKTPDSTLLPYKLSEGLKKPPTPECTKERKAHQEKVQYLQSELNKRRVELFEEAKRRQCQGGNLEDSEICVSGSTNENKQS